MAPPSGRSAAPDNNSSRIEEENKLRLNLDKIKNKIKRIKMCSIVD